MVLPFQALECYLDGVCPYEGTEEAGKQYLTQMVRSSTLKAKICETYDGLVSVKLLLFNEIYDVFFFSIKIYLYLRFIFFQGFGHK